MTEKRLSSLALIKIHRDIVADLDFDKLVVDFANKHPRRMALPCISQTNFFVSGLFRKVVFYHLYLYYLYFYYHISPHTFKRQWRSYQ